MTKNLSRETRMQHQYLSLAEFKYTTMIELDNISTCRQIVIHAPIEDNDFQECSS